MRTAKIEPDLRLVPKWVTEWAPGNGLLVKLLPCEFSCDVIEI